MTFCPEILSFHGRHLAQTWAITRKGYSPRAAHDSPASGISGASRNATRRSHGPTDPSDRGAALAPTLPALQRLGRRWGRLASAEVLSVVGRVAAGDSAVPGVRPTHLRPAQGPTMTRRRVVSTRELGLIVAVLALPVAVVQTGSNLPLLGGTAGHGGTPVALGVRATAVEGSHAAHISKGTTTSDERARPDAHMGGAVSFVQTAGDDSSGGVPPAQGDPGRAGGGGSGARSPGAPADPPTPSDEDRDPDPDPHPAVPAGHRIRTSRRARRPRRPNRPPSRARRPRVAT